MGGTPQNLHRWLQTGRSRWNWCLFGINRNIQVYKTTESLQYLSGGSVAIQAAKLLWDKNVHRRKISILSDIQASIKALDASVTNSKTVYDWRTDMMFVLFGYRDIRIFRVIVDRMNWPERE